MSFGNFKNTLKKKFIHSKYKYDTENWMKNLPIHIQNEKLNCIAIPGSHDSATSKINKNSKISPDNEAYEYLAKLGILGRELSSCWSKTQRCDIYEQLKSGIRYLDLRVYIANDKEYFIVHGQYSFSLSHVFNEVHEFLILHPREVVIMDINHLYNFEDKSDVRKLGNYVVSHFGNKLVRYKQKLPTLSEMWSMEQQIICSIIHWDDINTLIWPTGSIVSPWPNTADPQCLLKFLDDEYKHSECRQEEQLFVFQGILTPATKTLFEDFSGLPKLAKEAANVVLPWLQRPYIKAGSHSINIVILDFCVLTNPTYTSTVINLNYQN